MRVVVRNRKAYHNFEVLQKIETGIELRGSEVKSVRAGKVNLADAYGMCKNGEIILQKMHISPWQGNAWFAPDPYRNRKLLLHKKEIARLCKEVQQKRLTLIPLSLYFSGQWLKVEIGVCRGKRKYDKRQAIAEKETKKRMERVMKNR